MVSGCSPRSSCRPGSAWPSPRGRCGACCGRCRPRRPPRMNDFVQLWVYLASTPLFGLTATLVVYVAVHAAHERLGRAAWANPVLWSVIAIGGLLLITHTPYPTYFAGAQFVHVMLGPAVVALAWALWLRRDELRRPGVALVIAALTGGAAAAGSAVALGWAFGMPVEVLRSLAPKSVTAPVAMGIAE